MKYNEIIDLCQTAIKSYNAVIHTIDTHSENFTKTLADENVKVFIKQVFYGYYRYKDFLQTFTEILFDTNAGTTNRNDGLLYAILTYLLVFRFYELPFHELKSMILGQDAVKMNVLLQFLFDVNKLNLFVKEAWCRLYDPSYIEDAIIQGLQEKLVDMAPLLAIISEKATGKKSELVESLKEETGEEEEKLQKKAFVPTKIQAFNLTKPKKKEIPQPIVISKQIHCNPVPEHLYSTNLERITQEKQKKLEEAKKEVQRKYAESKAQRFSLKTEARPQNLEKLKEEVQKSEEAKLSFNQKYQRPVPDQEKNPAAIRLNVASIVREEHQLRAKEREEEQILKDLEVNLRDSTEFKLWKQRNQELERVQELEYLQKKKIEMELAREAATKAVLQKNCENKQLVSEMKEISLKKADEREKKREKALEYKKTLRHAVIETKENANIEREKALKRNKEVHDCNKQEINELLLKKREESEVEMRKKQELIKKIREIQKQPKQRTHGFDPTETMGLGLLEEMSLEQLREKLQEVQKQRKLEESQKRQENSRARDSYLRGIQEKVAYISSRRQELREENAAKRQEKREFSAKEEQKLAQIREKSLLEVYTKVVEKKDRTFAEKQRLAQELREIKQKRQYLNANEAKVEEKKWKALADGAEREIKARQNEKLIDQEKLESIKLKERKLLSVAAETFLKKKVDFLNDYDRKVLVASKENEEFYKEERQEKAEKYQTIKEFERGHTQNLISRDTYKQKITMKTTKPAQKTAKTAETLVELPAARYET